MGTREPKDGDNMIRGEAAATLGPMEFKKPLCVACAKAWRGRGGAFKGAEACEAVVGLTEAAELQKLSGTDFVGRSCAGEYSGIGVVAAGSVLRRRPRLCATDSGSSNVMKVFLTITSGLPSLPIVGCAKLSLLSAITPLEATL
jgi:hypothetical protein